MHLANGAIEINPEKLGGTPVFSGTRVPIDNLFDVLEAGEPIEEFLDGFPPITREQVTAVLEFYHLEPSEMVRPNPDDILGDSLWLSYLDQNTNFERAFPPQNCTVVRRVISAQGTDDWYLVRLSHTFS